MAAGKTDDGPEPGLYKGGHCEALGSRRRGERT